MKKAAILILSVLCLNSVYAQQPKPCAIDYYDSIAIANDPSILLNRQSLEQFTNEFLTRKNTNEELLIIPVVFHVLHRYGNERIALSEIERGIVQINKDFSAQNMEVNNVITEFKDIIGNANLEFRLAQIDPNGNCTQGVVYYDTELTYKASNLLKYTIKSWNPSKYLNVWTVASIESGAAAWSHYPGVSSTLDGVVSIYQYISGHTLGHEVGHYLNLAHPWGSTNEPGLESNCDIDDGVEDTPLTIGVDQHCNLYQVSCGSLDNVQNFMDYTTCEAMFTEGQTLRMRAALNSSVSNRNNLWTVANLASTGTSDGYESVLCEPTADFSSNLPIICPGESLAFTDYSYGGAPTQWNWVFEGGNPTVSDEQNPTVTYNEPGLYSVSLTVSNSSGESELVRDQIVFVNDTLKGIVAPAIVTMEEEGFPNYENDIFKAWRFENEGSANWTLFTNNNNKALRIKNNGNESGAINSVITSNINVSEIENPDYLYFDYAYAQRDESSKDELKIFVSAECSESWTIKTFLTGKSLVTSNNEYVTTEFIPTSDEWNQARIPISSYSDKNFLKVKFQMKSSGGNYLYIDNLKIGNLVGVSDFEQSHAGCKIYPNPSDGSFNIKFNLAAQQPITIDIINVLGNKVVSETVHGVEGENIIEMQKDNLNLNKGIYWVVVKGKTTMFSKSVILN